MDENAIHQWLIDCFGQIQGEMAWQQLSQLPQEVRDQLAQQNPDNLPKPDEVRAMMKAFTEGGLNSLMDMQQAVDRGPINVKLASTIALERANDEESWHTVNAQDAASVRRAASEANLWLDSACAFDPAPGEPDVLTRADWVNGTLNSWATFAAPVASAMNEALASVVSERLGDTFGGEIAGVYAGPIPIPIPDNLKDPGQIVKLLANTSFAIQLGHAAGDLSHEVRGSFDQSVPLLGNPAGGIIAQNAIEYARSLDIDQSEVLAFLALQEEAHARLFAAVPWLMPRFEALIGKYARGTRIDLDAMEEQLRDAQIMNPDSFSGAVNLTNVAIPDTPEQREALSSLERLLAAVEGWVDCVTWKAGMAHLPHLDQLREMMRRERAVGGVAQRSFESLLGLQLRPKRLREAADLWASIDAQSGMEERDARWSHPDLLPQLPSETAAPHAASSHSDTPADTATDDTQTASSIDWDAELSKLLDEDARQHAESETGDSANAGGSDASDIKASDAKAGGNTPAHDAGNLRSSGDADNTNGDDDGKPRQEGETGADEPGENR